MFGDCTDRRGVISFFFAPVSHAAPAMEGRDIKFEATITAKQIVDRTCVIEAKTNGGLDPNDDITEMSSLSNGGRDFATVSVTTGATNVQLSTSNETLLQDDTRIQPVNLLLASGVFKDRNIASSILSQTSDKGGRLYEAYFMKLINEVNADAVLQQAKIKNSLRLDQKQTVTAYVWFRASLIQEDDFDEDFASLRKRNPTSGEPLSRFEPGAYTGQTTVTCEPR